jgi:plasmid maintenance system antidote protein VapI
MLLRDFMHQKKHLNKSAAEALEVSPSYLSLLANGRATPSMAVALRIHLWSDGAVSIMDWGATLTCELS